LSEWAKKHKKQLPRIAGLGGVSAATLLQLYDNGFEGAALLGAIWESADPIAAFNTLQQANDNPAGA
jgi:thiamine-phosphate pyrophosphorylase